jgi:hypothetical protein
MGISFILVDSNGQFPIVLTTAVLPANGLFGVLRPPYFFYIPSALSSPTCLSTILPLTPKSSEENDMCQLKKYEIYLSFEKVLSLLLAVRNNG